MVPSTLVYKAQRRAWSLEETWEVAGTEALLGLTHAWPALKPASSKRQVCGTGISTKQGAWNALLHLICQSERIAALTAGDGRGQTPADFHLGAPEPFFAERLVCAVFDTENVTFLPVMIWPQMEGAVFKPGFPGRGGEGH